MTFANPQMESTIEFTPGAVQTLVIENRRFFRYITGDIFTQTEGGRGDSVLSENYAPVSFANNAEYIDCFNGFSINRKALLNKIIPSLERRANDAEFYAQTSELLSGIEQYIYSLSADMFADVECSKVSIGAVLKMAGINICDRYDDPLERLIDYMELVREYDRNRLFVFINMRSYFENEELELFFDNVLSRELMIFLIDSFEDERLKGENRLVVDKDLCEL